TMITLLAMGSTLPAVAQEGFNLEDMRLPGLSEYAPPQSEDPLALARGAQVTLAAQLSENSAEIPSGLVWRIFSPEPDRDGKLPLIATASGGTSTFSLAPGS